ncbi:hypothetical protein BXZ70DRAFT_972621, partial [Cristinia sonorae]
MASSTFVLRKRKHSAAEDPLILQLSSSPSPSADPFSESDYEPPPQTFHIPTSIVDSISARAPRKKRYRCSYEGCTNSYSKPSRLAEHERSHTGDRPFVCSPCNKRYLRESHLQAHSRSHLPSSSRPFACTEDQCNKRFWTAQHLRAHVELHKGEKPFKCTERDCEAAFAKHHQLRDHICTNHAPPGTKPYRCDYEACSKSFLTAQKLRTHVKTHDDKRYTCVHPACTVPGQTSPTYYPTWTALQQHMRTNHPPKCPYPSCNGKTFTTQKGLRAHLKIHEQREVEESLRDVIPNNTYEGEDEREGPPQKKRRGGEVGRDFVCEFAGCGKDFKSKKALTNHHNVNHLGRRDFVCTHPDCSQAFGYKHLLQRHLARVHVPESGSEGEGSEEDNDTQSARPSPKAVSTTATSQGFSFSIDDITGVSYSMQAQAQIQATVKLRCPHPDISSFMLGVPRIATSGRKCQYVFTRAYDLRRHLKSEHGLDVEKDLVDVWVLRAKKDARKTDEAL